MSTTSEVASNAPTPRRVRSASSSPESRRVAKPKRRPDLGQELGAVRGVARGARRDRERSLGAERLELVAGSSAIVASVRAIGSGWSRRDGVDALAEPRHHRAAEHVVDPRLPRRRRRAAASSSCRCRSRRRASLAGHVAAHAPVRGVHLAGRAREDAGGPERLLQVRLGALEPRRRCSLTPAVRTSIWRDRCGDSEHGHLGRALEPAEGAPGVERPSARRRASPPTMETPKTISAMRTTLLTAPS